jgi:hypothetical protein
MKLPVQNKPVDRQNVQTTVTTSGVQPSICIGIKIPHGGDSICVGVGW